jgi:hypothetical protein
MLMIICLSWLLREAQSGIIKATGEAMAPLFV